MVEIKTSRLIKLQNMNSSCIGEVVSPVPPVVAEAVASSVAEYELDREVARDYPTPPLDTVLEPWHLANAEAVVTDAEWMMHEGHVPEEVLEMRAIFEKARTKTLSEKPHIPVSEIPVESTTSISLKDNEHTRRRVLCRSDLLVAATVFSLLNLEYRWIN